MKSLQIQLAEAIKDVPDFPKSGILFRDISPIFLEPALVRACVAEIARPWQNQGINKVIGIESRGFLLGPQIAEALGAGFVLARKQGKLPPETVSYTYELEYGTATIEIGRDVIDPRDRVLVHDDLLATGGTAAAVATLVQQLGAEVGGFGFMIELTALKGNEKIQPISSNIHALIEF